MLKSFLSLTFLCLLSFATLGQVSFSHTSLRFDGVDDYVDCTAGNRNITNQVTVEAWVRFNSNASMWVAGKYDAATNLGYRLYLQNGFVAFGGSSANSSPVGSGFSQTNLADNKWHHIAGTYNAGIWQIWVDGFLENSGTGPAVTLTSTVPFTIAKNSTSATQYFKGNMGEIKVWNTVRSQTELRENMCRYLTNTAAPLVAYFKLEGRLNYPTPSPVTAAPDDSYFNLSGLVYVYSGNPGYMPAPPPIGVENVHFYGKIQANSIFKILGDTPGFDSLAVRILSGNPKAIHLYRTDRSPHTTYTPASVGHPMGYFGIMVIGDSSTTYHVSYTYDTTLCRLDFYIFSRPNSFQFYFRKHTPGNDFDLIADKSTEAYGRDRSEHGFLFRNPAPRNYFNGTSYFCEMNGTLELKPTRKSFSYLWNTGDTTRNLIITKPGKYYVTATDYCLSLSSDTFNVVLTTPQPFPIKSPVADTVICKGQTITLNLPSGYTYRWQDNATTQTYQITEAGNYTATLTEPNCQSSQQYSFFVRPLDCSENAYFPNIITPDNDGLNDYFTIAGLPLPEYTLHIYNRWGQLVYQTDHYKNDWNGEKQSAGVYYYLLQHKRSAKKYKGYLEIVK